MYVGLYLTYPLFLSDFNETWIFWTDFRKKTQISKFMKIRLVGPELFHADGRTDMTKLIVAFRNFANTPNNSQYTLYQYNESSTAANFFAINSTDLHAYKTCSNSLSRIFIENYEESWFNFRQRSEILFSKLSRPAVGPTHAPIQRYLGLRPGKQADGEWNYYSLPSSAVIKNPWIYTSTPPCVSKRGAWLSIGTTLPFKTVFLRSWHRVPESRLRGRFWSVPASNSPKCCHALAHTNLLPFLDLRLWYTLLLKMQCRPTEDTNLFTFSFTDSTVCERINFKGLPRRTISHKLHIYLGGKRKKWKFPELEPWVWRIWSAANHHTTWLTAIIRCTYLRGVNNSLFHFRM